MSYTETDEEIYWGEVRGEPFLPYENDAAKNFAEYVNSTYGGIMSQDDAQKILDEIDFHGFELCKSKSDEHKGEFVFARQDDSADCEFYDLKSVLAEVRLWNNKNIGSEIDAIKHSPLSANVTEYHFFLDEKDIAALPERKREMLLLLNRLQSKLPLEADRFSDIQDFQSYVNIKYSNRFLGFEDAKKILGYQDGHGFKIVFGENGLLMQIDEVEKEKDFVTFGQLLGDAQIWSDDLGEEKDNEILKKIGRQLSRIDPDDLVEKREQEKIDRLAENKDAEIEEEKKSLSAKNIATNFVLEKLEKAGIEVISDKSEFKRILDTEEILQKMSQTEKFDLFATNNNERLNEEINSLTINDVNVKNKYIDIADKTPFIFKECGLDEHPVKMYKQKLARAFFLEKEKPGERRTHGHKGEFSIQTAEETFAQLGNPRFIFNSKKNITNPDDYYLIGIYDKFDNEGNPMILSLRYNRNDNNIEANWVQSIYGRRKNDVIYGLAEGGYLLYANDIEMEKASAETCTLYMRVMAAADAYVSNIIKKSHFVNDLGISFYKIGETTYGFTYDDKIYLNPDVMNSEVAVHEYTHLWDVYTRRTNSELWQTGKNLLSMTHLWKDVKNDPNCADIANNDDLVLSEVHARICGDTAQKVLEKIAEEDGEIAKNKVIDWDKEVWEHVSHEIYTELNHKNEIGGTSKEQKAAKDLITEFVSMPLKELLSGKNIKQKEIQEEKNAMENKKHSAEDESNMTNVLYSLARDFGVKNEEMLDGDYGYDRSLSLLKQVADSPDVAWTGSGKIMRDTLQKKLKDFNTSFGQREKPLSDDEIRELMKRTLGEMRFAYKLDYPNLELSNVFFHSHDISDFYGTDILGALDRAAKTRNATLKINGIQKYLSPDEYLLPVGKKQEYYLVEFDCKDFSEVGLYNTLVREKIINEATMKEITIAPITPTESGTIAQYMNVNSLDKATLENEIRHLYPKTGFDKRKQGSLFQNTKWGHIFDELGKERYSDCWIEKKAAGGWALNSSDGHGKVLSNTIPEEFSDFIEREFDTSKKHVFGYKNYPGKKIFKSQGLFYDGFDHVFSEKDEKKMEAVLRKTAESFSERHEKEYSHDKCLSLLKTVSKNLYKEYESADEKLMCGDLLGSLGNLRNKYGTEEIGDYAKTLSERMRFEYETRYPVLRFSEKFFRDYDFSDEYKNLLATLDSATRYSPGRLTINGIKKYTPLDADDKKEHILIEYDTTDKVSLKMPEDELFNIISEYTITSGKTGMQIEVNPITPEKSGTIEEYLEKIEQWRKEDMAKTPVHLAPNGKASELSEEDFEYVQSDEFKSRFGDWEKAYRLDKLIRSEPVKTDGKIIVNGRDETDKISGLRKDRNIAELKKIASALGDAVKGKSYTNNDTADRIYVSGNNIREVSNHNIKDVGQLESIALIPEILKNGIFIAESKNENIEKPQYQKFKYLVCGLKINGEDYTVKSDIGVKKDGSCYYDHKLTEIEKGTLVHNLTSLLSGEYQTKAPYGQYDKRLVQICQCLQAPFLTENFEPKKEVVDAVRKGKTIYELSEEKPFTVFTAWKVQDRTALLKKYNPVLDMVYSHHITNQFGLQMFNEREGEKRTVKITGRLTTENVDALLVDAESENAYPHITLSARSGFSPVKTNGEIAAHLNDIEPLSDEVETVFTNFSEKNLAETEPLAKRDVLIKEDD